MAATVFRFSTRSMIRFLRGLASLALFAVFGVGAVFLTPLMLVLRRPERCQPVVRALWRPLVWLFIHTGLLSVEAKGLEGIRSSVIVANHPSLIDVVLVTVLVPRTLYVAKSALRASPVLAAIVRATSLPDDARLPESAATYLARGWNLLVFPEGTRSPSTGGLHPFRRGAAQVALRTGSPIVCVEIRPSERILAKRQPVTAMGAKRVVFALRRLATLPPVNPPPARPHAAAVRLVATMEKLYRSSAVGFQASSTRFR